MAHRGANHFLYFYMMCKNVKKMCVFVMICFGQNLKIHTYATGNRPSYFALKTCTHLLFTTHLSSLDISKYGRKELYPILTLCSDVTQTHLMRWCVYPHDQSRILVGVRKYCTYHRFTRLRHCTRLRWIGYSSSMLQSRWQTIKREFYRISNVILYYIPRQKSFCA